jgi:iron(III) transport system ATP-binding protein
VAGLTYAEVRKEFGEVKALRGLDLEVADGELLALLGPSGSGKSTALRLAAGLDDVTAGTIHIGSRDVTHLAPARRNVSMVFQSYALFPHLTVAENIGFGLRARGVPRADAERGVAEAARITGCDALLGRKPHELSGGERQRVALARALARHPDVFLLDEPLSNLDAKLRESLRFELKRLQRELGITSIYVTHDQLEALALSSRVAVMSEGRIEQLGRPREIYENPRSRFVAEFIGTSNFINGVVADRRGDCFTVETSEGRLKVDGAADVALGAHVVVSIRPEAVELSTRSWDGTVPNEWSGTITNRAFLGDSVDHVIGVGKFSVRNRSNPSISVAPGTDVYLHMDPTKLSLVPIEE